MIEDLRVMVIKLSLFCSTIALISTYQHKIYISHKFDVSACEKANGTFFQCHSLEQAFEQLTTCCNSTKIIIEPGYYSLNMSFTFYGLANVCIQSYSQDEVAVIKCPSNINGNYNFDTGLGFVGVTNLTLEHVKFLGCGMKHVSGIQIETDSDERKFIFLRSALFILNSTNIFLFNINISESNGIGLLMFDTNGTVNISSSYFTENKLNSKEATKYLAGGGGIYIEFTNCTPGVTACDPHTNLYNTLSEYTIDHCVFTGNTAVYNFIDDEPDRLASNVHVSFGSGGGLSVQFHGHAKNISFQVFSCLFSMNEANSGGGLCVDTKQNPSHNHVEIKNSTLLHNSAHTYQGGGGAYMGIAIYQPIEQSFYNVYIVVNCTFKHNTALYGVGGGIFWYASRESGRAQPTNQFEIYNCSFVDNEAQYGSAIQINKEYHASLERGSMLTLIIDSCYFFSNNLQALSSSSDSVGAISASGVSIQFRNFNQFIKNNSTALVIDSAFAEFHANSFTEFSDNKGLRGGAILLIGDSWIQVHSDSTLLFVRNTAVHYGGAIFVELSTPYDYILSHSCFVRFSSTSISPDRWSTNFTFINNTAGNTSNTIFANTLRPCLKFYATSTCASLFLRNKPFYYHPNDTMNLIATSPMLFNFSDTNSSIITLAPGQTYDLQVDLVDELCQKYMYDVMFIATCIESVSPHVVARTSFTDGPLQIAGWPMEFCQLQLKTDSDYQITKIMQVVLLNCPPGFVHNEETEQCECISNHLHQNPVITGCDLTFFQAYFDQSYWIGYKSDNATDLLVGICPHRYCYEDLLSKNQLLPGNANKTILDNFVCGKRHRTGLLCGQCIPGYSVAMNSPTFACSSCKHSFGALYLLLSYFLPVGLLFYIIMTFNVRLTSGPISAFLFFSQIISSQYYFDFSYALHANSAMTLSVSNILLSIYSVSNLNFFHHETFSYCLFAQAGTVDILAFNILLSLYPILLIIIYCLLRRYNHIICRCRCRSNCYRISANSVTHGICAFLVLSFAKINATVFAILKSTDIYHLNDTMMTYKTVVYMQGDIDYFGIHGMLYNVYATASILLILVLIVIPLLILMLYPCLTNIFIILQKKESNLIDCISKGLFIHKLKPILDSFQGDYKDHLQFFSGLHFFLYKSLFFSIVMAASTPNIDSLLFSVIVYFFLTSLVHTLTMPFKTYRDNAIYSSMFMLILALLFVEFYISSTKISAYSETLLWFKLLLLALPLCFLAAFCSFEVMNRVLDLRKRKNIEYQLLPDFPDRLVHEDGNDYDDDDDDDDDI